MQNKLLLKRPHIFVQKVTEHRKLVNAKKIRKLQRTTVSNSKSETVETTSYFLMTDRKFAGLSTGADL